MLINLNNHNSSNNNNINNQLTKMNCSMIQLKKPSILFINLGKLVIIKYIRELFILDILNNYKHLIMKYSIIIFILYYITHK